FHRALTVQPAQYHALRSEPDLPLAEDGPVEAPLAPVHGLDGIQLDRQPGLIRENQRAGGQGDASRRSLLQILESQPPAGRVAATRRAQVTKAAGRVNP